MWSFAIIACVIFGVSGCNNTNDTDNSSTASVQTKYMNLLPEAKKQNDAKSASTTAVVADAVLNVPANDVVVESVELGEYFKEHSIWQLVCPDRIERYIVFDENRELHSECKDEDGYFVNGGFAYEGTSLDMSLKFGDSEEIIHLVNPCKIDSIVYLASADNQSDKYAYALRFRDDIKDKDLYFKRRPEPVKSVNFSPCCVNDAPDCGDPTCCCGCNDEYTFVGY